MNLPVEATIHLKNFPDKKMVREILKSHGFTLMDLNSDQVRVKGSFSKLRNVKAHLEQLQNQMRIPLSSSPVQSTSSGAISKYYTKHSLDVSDGKANHLKYRDKPSPASPSSPDTSLSWRSGSFHNRPTSAESRAAFSQRPDHSMSFRRGMESFVVDADVLKYARRLRKKDIEGILASHAVRLEEVQVGNNMNITLQGKSAKMAAGKLQSLLNDLSKSLRTQEVLLKDMDRDSQALLEKIEKDKNIYKSVLVCMMSDRLHLIGPSGESYELKQRLSGRPVDHSGRTGRTFDRDSRKRSHSLPPLTGRTAGRERDANANPSPVGARGYSPSKYQDVGEDSDESEWVSTGCFGKPTLRRSQSMSRMKNSPEKSNAHMQEKKTERTPRSFFRNPLLKISGKDIKKTLQRKK